MGGGWETLADACAHACICLLYMRRPLEAIGLGLLECGAKVREHLRRCCFRGLSLSAECPRRRALRGRALACAELLFNDFGAKL